MNRSSVSWKRQTAATVVALSAIVLFTIRAVSQEPEQKSFSSPGEAVQALISALEINDKRALLVVLGPAAKDVTSSGDEVADNSQVNQVLERDNQQRSLAASGTGKETLLARPAMSPLPNPPVP